MDKEIEELKQKHREKGTANKDNKDLLELANKLLGGNSQMLLKYNDLPYFDVLKDEDKATYRVYTDGSDKFEKIKDAAKKEDEEPKVEDVDTTEVDIADTGKDYGDELDAYTKDLEDYMKKNPKAKDKNYY